MGVKLRRATGLGPFVPLYKVRAQLQQTKEMLRQDLGLGFITSGNMVAAYTNIAQHIQFILKQPGIQDEITFPKQSLIIYDYLDEYGYLPWSQFSTGETSIQIKLVKPNNLLSMVLKVGM